MKSYSILIANSARKEIERLQPQIKEKVASALLELSIDPFLGKALKAQLTGLYSYRIGGYRIIYDIIKDKVIIRVLKVMHRRDVYR